MPKPRWGKKMIFAFSLTAMPSVGQILKIWANGFGIRQKHTHPISVCQIFQNFGPVRVAGGIKIFLEN
jgi:hypothetical protein